MKTVIIFLAVFFLPIVFAFMPPKHSIVGHWVAYESDGSEIDVDFKSDGTFDTHYEGKLLTWHDWEYYSLDHYGNYTFNDPVFSVDDKEDDDCGNGYWGKYNVTFVGEDSVSFTLFKDSCSVRGEQVNGGGLRREMQ